jgi:hypothetical protein
MAESNGKGDRYRKVDRGRFEAGYERAFGCRDRYGGKVCPGNRLFVDRCKECECYKPSEK